MGLCQICGRHSPMTSGQLGVCLPCIRSKPEKALKITDIIHEDSRRVFGLPAKPPNDPHGISCAGCSNGCKIGIGGKGFCGLVLNVDRRLVRTGGTTEKGILSWYYDPLPTNCVAWWFCPGCTGAGYPKYAYERGAEKGFSNLAVFYGACSLDCLFCQNWHYRNLTAALRPTISAESLAAKADDRVACACFFGGDPSVQMPHALRVSQIALDRAREEERILRVCWETNGYWTKEAALRAAEFSLISGGNIKIDLKAWDENLSLALCGVSNKPALESFRMIGKEFFGKRPELPLLSASTLLVPGYVDAEEVSNLASFIAEIDPHIPYTLLAFHPQYLLSDLPTTSRSMAQQCFDAAKKYLDKVRIGNVHLLS
ncbi:MAG: radical SAM protein [Candidatus Methanosuratincola sp.]